MASHFNVLDYVIRSVLKLLLHMDFQIYLATLNLNFECLLNVRCCAVLRCWYACDKLVEFFLRTVLLR